MTATGRSGSAPGSLTSPACWTCRAGRDARHHPQGAPAPRHATAVHRYRRPPLHRLRHQREERPCRRPRTTAPPPGPLRGRIRNAKDTGLRNLPLKGFAAANQVWCKDRRPDLRTAGLDPDDRPGWPRGRRWEPRRLRLRRFSVAGRLARGDRRLRLRLAERWSWAAVITAAIARLQALPAG